MGIAHEGGAAESGCRTAVAESYSVFAHLNVEKTEFYRAILGAFVAARGTPGFRAGRPAAAGTRSAAPRAGGRGTVHRQPGIRCPVRRGASGALAVTRGKAESVADCRDGFRSPARGVDLGACGAGHAGVRHRALRTWVVRRLLDDPVLYYDELDAEARAYLDRQRTFILRELAEATGLEPEVRLEGIALADPEGDCTDLGLPEEGTEGKRCRAAAGPGALRAASHRGSRGADGDRGSVRRTGGTRPPRQTKWKRRSDVSVPGAGDTVARWPSPRREDQWQPLRCGLLNPYRYEDDEFRFEDGRLLLRGDNGSGKSRVLALQLPFLLDGDVSPSRVEPDGDPAKRIEWHLLMGRWPDRTGYTWIEFGRRRPDGGEAFVTLGSACARWRGTPDFAAAGSSRPRDEWGRTYPCRVRTDVRTGVSDLRRRWQGKDAFSSRRRSIGRRWMKRTSFARSLNDPVTLARNTSRRPSPS